ncbi:unnamed protein product [Closterium sp. Naga37s-1]|nr:unnamed protein product [Closterium sp. Naga37s-1]
MFGPIFEDPTAADRQHGPLYFVSVCAAPAGGTEGEGEGGEHTEEGQGTKGGGAGEENEGKQGKWRVMECTDPEGKPIATMACRVNPQVMLDEQHRGSHSLGDRVSLFPFYHPATGTDTPSHSPSATAPFPDPLLARRGLVMVLEGERCPFSMQGGGGEQSRWGMGGDAEKGKGKGKGKGEGGEEKYGRLTLTFICDPNAGEVRRCEHLTSHLSFAPPLAPCTPSFVAPLWPLSSPSLTGIGHPSPWTEEGRRAAFNTSLPFPAWTKRGGDPVPVTQGGGDGVVPGCAYELAWYSAYACPLCSEEDVEEVPVADCHNNKRATYKYRHPRLAWYSAYACPLCSEEDVEEVPVADCHNNKRATYKYRHPRVSGGLVPGCAYELAWYGAYACPLCSEEDVEEVPVGDCHKNKWATFKYPHPRAPLPPDQLCSPCTADDYSVSAQCPGPSSSRPAMLPVHCRRLQ